MLVKIFLIGLFLIASVSKIDAFANFGNFGIVRRSIFPSFETIEQDFDKSMERNLDDDEKYLVNMSSFFRPTTVAPVSKGQATYKCFHEDWNHAVDDTRCFLHEVVNLNFTITDAYDRKISFIKFRNSSLATVPRQIFDYFPLLRDLIIDNTSIQFIDNSTFNSGVNLVYIILSDNKLKSIKENTFSQLGKLQILDLKRNEIETVHKNAFAGLIELRMLSLDSNKIKVINFKTLWPLKNLVSFGMKQNQLQTLPEKLFENCQGIKFVDFSNNFINSLPANLFNDLNSYTYINLNDNVCVNGEFMKFTIFDKNSLYDACMADGDKIKWTENMGRIRDRVDAIEGTVKRLDSAITIDQPKKLSDAITEFDKKLKLKSEILNIENTKKINEAIFKMDHKIKQTSELNNENLKSSIDKTADEIIQNTVNEMRKQAKDRYDDLNTKIYLAFFSLMLAGIGLCGVYYKLRTPMKKVGDREQIL